MKVILQQDVAKIGRRFDVVEVPTGYALNHLLPSGAAIAATPENAKRINAQKEHTKAEREAFDSAFSELCERIKGTTVTVAAKASEQGHLFEGLNTERIATLLAEQGVTVSSNQIDLGSPIKEVGEHTLTLASGDTSATITFNVTAA